jgi:hypothetical protein
MKKMREDGSRLAFDLPVMSVNSVAQIPLVSVRTYPYIVENLTQKLGCAFMGIFAVFRGFGFLSFFAEIYDFMLVFIQPFEEQSRQFIQIVPTLARNLVFCFQEFLNNRNLHRSRQTLC